MPRFARSAALVAVVFVLVGVFASSAQAVVTYAGPKTWLSGWWEDGNYDSLVSEWWYNEMGPKSDDVCYTFCTSRVAFIDGSGNWHYSRSDATSWTSTYIPFGEDYFRKKPYCKNNSDWTYDAECNV
jgi:hypothetical protein